MKFCQKCGKEIMDEAVVCPGCGCEVGKQVKKQEVSYEDCIKNSGRNNIISIVLIAVAVICWLFVNMWLGAILCLVAEFIALSGNSKVQKAFKQNGLVGSSKEIKEQKKAIMKDLKAKSSAYKLSWVLGIVALVLLIIFVMFI